MDESEAAWPEPVRAAKGAPNVLFIVLDDTGYGHLGCYGGLCDTPNFDRLAAEGLLYTQMHTTALCSPTRSCVLTGRNHHANGMAAITEVSTGFPGYDGLIPFENGFLSEILVGAGYNTYAVGKWHLTPAEQLSAAGPYDRWPLGRGFERYYGFLGGDTHQYYPDLVEDNRQVDPPKTPEEGYHLTEDLVDKALGMVRDAKQVAPDKPFFLYFAPGAMHAPHHVPKPWIDAYRGKFDQGWDAAREEIFRRQQEKGIIPSHAKLPEHDPDVARWDDLTEDERRLYARMMEVFAGFLTHTDHHIGRMLDGIDALGELDNTLVMVISDNGASPEGGPHGSVNENRFFNFIPESFEENLAAIDGLGGPQYFNHYPWGWTWAGNTPFRRWKRETFRGGISDPFLVRWPRGFSAKGEMRHAYVHAIDMLPTVIDALGISPPMQIRGITQSPLHGQSFLRTFETDDPNAGRSTQYFEMIGHRSLYHRGWRAVCPWPGDSFAAGKPFGTPITADDLRALDERGWQLYDLEQDPTESTDVAAEHPERLHEMIALWYVEAGRYGVLPIDGRGQQRFAEPRPQITKDRQRYVYYPQTQSIPESAAAHLLNRSFVVSADVEIQDGDEGVMLCHGGNTGGYSFFLQDHQLHYVYNYVGAQEFHVASENGVTPGKHRMRLEFERDGEADPRVGKGAPGRVRLFVDDERVAEGEIPVTIPLLMGLGGGLMCGRANASPITDLYAPPYVFTGQLQEVAIEIGREALTLDEEAQMRVAMSRQ